MTNERMTKSNAQGRSRTYSSFDPLSSGLVSFGPWSLVLGHWSLGLRHSLPLFLPNNAPICSRNFADCSKHTATITIALGTGATAGATPRLYIVVVSV